MANSTAPRDHIHQTKRFERVQSSWRGQPQTPFVCYINPQCIGDEVPYQEKKGGRKRLIKICGMFGIISINARVALAWSVSPRSNQGQYVCEPHTSDRQYQYVPRDFLCDLEGDVNCRPELLDGSKLRQLSNKCGFRNNECYNIWLWKGSFDTP